MREPATPCATECVSAESLSPQALVDRPSDGQAGVRAESVADPADPAGGANTSGGGAADGQVARPAWADLLIGLSPLSLVLVLYWCAQWLTSPIDGIGDRNRLGLPLHVTGPASVDQAVFGTLPTVWLQSHLVDGTPHWYDAVAALTYASHYLVLPIVTLVVWFAHRDQFRAWVCGVMALVGVGVAGYLLVPAAPPWLASQWEVIGPVSRISAAGWQVLHLDAVGHLLSASQSTSNPVAAMPSLHAAVPVLVLGFLWRSAGVRLRSLFLAYAVLMALVLVYTGEHYAVDVVAGWLTGVVAVLVAGAVRRGTAERRGSTRHTPSSVAVSR